MTSDNATLDLRTPKPVLVAGASGLLGGAVVKRLLARGIRVRAVSRSREHVDQLKALGVDVSQGDLMDREVASRACAGVGDVVATANNVMGSGVTSPHRVDVALYRTLCSAAREGGVKRIVSVSADGLTSDSSVDFFRVKYQVDHVIKTSGIPYVLLQPTAFMDVWAGQIIGDGIRDKGVATLFGNGQAIVNLIAVDDVADFADRIVADPTLVNETIVVGGPSNVSLERVAELIEAALGVRAKRRYVPKAILRAGSILLRPFAEVPARMMAMGYFTATRDGSLVNWETAARRFGISPRTIERFVEDRYVGDRARSSQR